MYSIKEVCPGAEVLRIEVTPYSRIQDQILTFFFRYGWLKLSECLYITPRVSKVNGHLFTKVPRV